MLFCKLLFRIGATHQLKNIVKLGYNELGCCRTEFEIKLVILITKIDPVITNLGCYKNIGRARAIRYNRVLQYLINVLSFFESESLVWYVKTNKFFSFKKLINFFLLQF